MIPGLRTVLVGRSRSRFQWTVDVLIALLVLVGTFGAYALDVFQVSGGVIVLPGAATLVGFVVAVGVGARRSGLLVAWVSLFAAYIGFQAEWAFLGLSSHSLGGKLAFLFDPVGLAVLGVASLIIGTVGFAVGSLGRLGIEQFRNRTGSQQSHE
ncbi:hypothetical protein [Halopenitus persicus]|uniref:Uncharacterized protein n=1 Tax=Halopenitus persicus TaxID=1048396 RepID=A0A1H3MVI1_9EURY|nr:hypothetical protein [Halopenitus persicus]SDY80543.1 hypothetical protein SAMN05216564_110102 [Halopenitus persicus]